MTSNGYRFYDIHHHEDSVSINYSFAYGYDEDSQGAQVWVYIFDAGLFDFQMTYRVAISTNGYYVYNDLVKQVKSVGTRKETKEMNGSFGIVYTTKTKDASVDWFIGSDRSGEILFVERNMDEFEDFEELEGYEEFKTSLIQ